MEVGADTADLPSATVALPGGRAARGLVAAMLLYNVPTLAVLAFAGVSFGLHGVALCPAVVLHAVMAVWCVTCLRRSPPNVTMDRNLRKQSNTETGPQ